MQDARRWHARCEEMACKMRGDGMQDARRWHLYLDITVLKSSLVQDDCMLGARLASISLGAGDIV